MDSRLTKPCCRLQNVPCRLQSGFRGLGIRAVFDPAIVVGGPLRRHHEQELAAVRHAAGAEHVENERRHGAESAAVAEQDVADQDAKEPGVSSLRRGR